mgnify:CR=1 FL=1
MFSMRSSGSGRRSRSTSESKLKSKTGDATEPPKAYPVFEIRRPNLSQHISLSIHAVGVTTNKTAPWVRGSQGGIREFSRVASETLLKALASHQSVQKAPRKFWKRRYKHRSLSEDHLMYPRDPLQEHQEVHRILLEDSR